VPDHEPSPSQIPESRALSRKRTGLSLVWIIPIVAAIIGAWVAVVKIREQGPTITIVLRSAEGIEAGKTKIRYNGLELGEIKTIHLADDHDHVIATAEMEPKTEDFFVEDTTFWVVRPQITGMSVTGLSTLISGAYLGMEIGKSKKRRHEFEALAAPPVISGQTAGRFFVLKTTDLGSVESGTPLYFRRLQVGQVASYSLDADGRTLTVKVFVDAPYDQFVTTETRFWQASGIDASFTANGLNLRTQSVLSMLIGGLAFETPDAAKALPPAEQNAEFTLYANRAEAYKPPPKNPQTYLLVFDQSVRGLSPGAPVEFRGIQIGSVEDVRAEFNTKTVEFSIPVTITVDPQRLGVVVHGAGMSKEDSAAAHRRMIDKLVAHGLRAQLRTGSLLTGALYVAVDFFPDAPPFTVDWSQTPTRIATVPGKLEGIDATVASIAKKLDQVPYAEIGGDLRKTMSELNETLAGARRAIDHADTLIESNSGIDQELVNALREVNTAARSLRVLSDYLERHPESLIRGKKEEK
jgi:paraquat-inducible protein B